MRFLEKIGQEQLASFITEDFLVLDRIHRGLPIPSFPVSLKIRLEHLIDLGIIERIGRGRNTQYLLCKRFYTLTGNGGIYTRKKGLDRETNKELLVKHLRLNSEIGAVLSELCQVLPSLSKRQVQELLRELKTEGRAYFKGKTKASVWFSGSGN